ncbi:MAG: hypothetical protein QNL17_01005 [Synechococcus sp. ChSW.bin.154]
MGAVLHEPWCRLDETLFAALDYPGDVMLKIQLFGSAPVGHSQGFDVFYPPVVLHRIHRSCLLVPPLSRAPGIRQTVKGIKDPFEEFAA